MSFQEQLVAFNEMYGLPVNEVPQDLGLKRLLDFKKALTDEVAELDEIIENAKLIDAMTKLEQQNLEDGELVPSNRAELTLKMMTDLADFLVDVQVYCGSECLKWGIPMEAVQHIVMASNMSKLGADGKPVVDDRGKVEKGPNYWKPEPLIAQALQELSRPNAWNPVSLAVHLVDCKQGEIAAGATTPTNP